MSGPKAADVQLKLSLAIESIQRQVTEAESNGVLYQQLGMEEAHASREAAIRAILLSVASRDAQETAREELQSLASLRHEADVTIAQGDQHMAEADRLRSQAEQLRTQSAAQLQQAVAICQQVVAAVSQAGLHRYEEEDHQARAGRWLANESLEQERQASQILQSAADQTGLARNAYDSVITQGSRLQAESRRIEEVAKQRRETARIAEEYQRKATAARQESWSLCHWVEQLNHGKFAPGEYSPIRAEVDRLESAFAGSNYEEVNTISSRCLNSLRSLCEKVAKAQSDWDSARRAAVNDLEMARKELGGIDRGFVARWAGDETAMSTAYARLDAAQAAFDREDFKGAQQETAAGLQAIRQGREQAAVNKARYDQRESISVAIMNALYDQGYDAPTFYFTDKDPAGKENPLSGLTIFAKSPGKLGDMRMKVQLDGRVDLEVEGIGEGEETECVNIINNLQQRLGGEIDFRMTDWGRAAGAENQQRVAVQTKEQVQEQVKERRRG